MNDYKAPDHDWYVKRNVTPPSAQPHGVAEDIRNNLRQLRPTHWHMKGNKLIGDTEMGTLVQMVPTNLILVGVDDDQLPIFRKVG